ncbi:ABC transporter permease subunit [Agromyces sp. NPDC058126]|uniref:ABC transporter permease subunit n=1 Tax=Agromyces sp. NPDC058126 TaxID=3346350 RepID=UPI0036D7D506
MRWRGLRPRLTCRSWGLPRTESLRMRQVERDTLTASARLTLLGILRSELFKVLTSRSSMWIVASMGCVIVGLGYARSLTSSPSEVGGTISEATEVAAVYAISGGVAVAQLLAATLGVLVSASEYSSRTIGFTFAAAPRRNSVLLAKALVVAGLTALTGAVALGLGVVVSSPALIAHGFTSEGIQAVALGVASRSTFVLMLTAILGVAVGTIVRSPIAGIASVVALFAAMPAAFNAISSYSAGTPVVAVGNIGRFLPESSARFYTEVPWVAALDLQQFAADGTLNVSGAQGLLILVAWTIGATLLSLLLLNRRDVGS